METRVGSVAGLALSPDGRTLVISSWSEGVTVWDTTTGQQTGSYPRLFVGSHIFLSDDGTRLLAGSGEIVAMFELR